MRDNDNNFLLTITCLSALALHLWGSDTMSIMPFLWAHLIMGWLWIQEGFGGRAPTTASCSLYRGYGMCSNWGMGMACPVVQHSCVVA